VRDQVLRLLARGCSAREVGRRLGVGYRVVTRVAGEAGLSFRRGLPGGLTGASVQAAHALVVPVGPVDVAGEWVDRQGRLSLEGRVAIQAWLVDEVSQVVIAARLGVHRSTVSRELARSGPGEPYRARDAHDQALELKTRPKPGKLDDPWVRAQVIAGLKKRWSPEQIAADLQVRFPGQHDRTVSHETIYQALYVQGKGSLRAELEDEKATRTGRTVRKHRSGLPPRRGRSWIGEATISARPAEADDRAVPGHWEGDLIIGAGGANALITLAERASRFTLIHRLPERHDAATVADALIAMMATLPAGLRRTLTWDQGSEMAAHAEFTLATDCTVYFCDPHSPWQRGTNENTNGLVRDWYPKGTDFSTVTDEQIQHVQDLLNTRPRKTLEWATPAATLAPLLDVAQTA
jgi:IS30 family transposase